MGIVQMREESEKESEKRCDLRRQQKMEREGTAVTCDGRLSTDERLQQETLCRRQWTDEYVERPETLMRQNIVFIWLQCLLFDVVSHVIVL